MHAMGFLDSNLTSSTAITGGDDSPAGAFGPQAVLPFLNTDSGKWVGWSLGYIVLPLINVTAILSNVINIVVFIKLGLDDGVTVTFLSLSVSDMLYSCFYLTNRILNGSQYILGQHPYIRLANLAYILGPYGRMFFDISIMITVFAGVQKCACVSIPLTFRNYFTLRKSVVTLVLIYTAALVYYVPHFSSVALGARVDPQFNRTRLLVKFPDIQLALALFRVAKSVNRISLPFMAEIILIFCVAVMTYKLREAASARHAMTSGQGDKPKEETDGDKGAKLSEKELRVIRSVNVICAVFVAGTAPRCVIEACDLSFTNFGDYTVNENLYHVVSAVQELVVGLSIAANIIVYYRFNTKYRAKFLEVFKCFQTKEDKLRT